MSRKRTKAPGRLYFWGSRALYFGPDVPATVHSHHAIQVCVGLSGPVRLRTGADSRWGNYAGAIIPSNVPHETDVPAKLLATFWLDPEPPDAKRLIPPSTSHMILRIASERLAEILPKLQSFWRERWDSKHAAGVLDEIVRTLASNESGAPRDPRVAGSPVVSWDTVCAETDSQFLSWGSTHPTKRHR